MVRLIASDVDGTLLEAGRTELPVGLFPLIEDLSARGIFFCAASGRQYESLKKLFAPVADQIIFLCENGAIVYRNDKVLAKTPLERADCVQLCAQILAQPGCEVLLSGANTSYVIPKSETYYRHIAHELGNHTVRVKSIDEIQEEIIKVSIFTDKPAADYAPVFAPVWDRHLNVAVAGKYWLDFTLAHKGTGLAQVTAALGLSSRDVAVFGDNFNDIPMFRFAGDSYAMEWAAEEVRRSAARTCPGVLPLPESLGL